MMPFRCCRAPKAFAAHSFYNDRAMLVTARRIVIGDWREMALGRFAISLYRVV
jgi:hypothetical protein